MAEARDRVIDSIVGLPLIGPALGRTKVARFVTDLEDTVYEAAQEGAAAEVKPMIIGTMVASGIAIWLAIRKS